MKDLCVLDCWLDKGRNLKTLFWALQNCDEQLIVDSISINGENNWQINQLWGLLLSAVLNTTKCRYLVGISFVERKHCTSCVPENGPVQWSFLSLYSTVTATLEVRSVREMELMCQVYLDLPILSSCGQHLCVSTEAHTQHCIVHHHEVILSLVLKILLYTMHTIT